MPPELREQVQSALGSNFTLDRELGGGGMSRVFLARDVALDRAIVVKVLSGEFTTGVSADRFRREIQLIARLQHPHVVPILSAGASDGGLYYTMPFFGGETLRARVAREGPMPIAQATRILREVLDALSFAHSHGVIHRDIKPENILLEAGHAVVADFGIAKALKESSNLTSTGMAVGTPAYMAPEQASADPSTDHRADLYSLGVIAYEMLSGAPPFTGSPQQVIRAHMVESPPSLLSKRPDAPAPLAQLVMRTLEKEASRRPQSAAEMLGVIDALVTPTVSNQAAAPARRRRNQVILVAGATAVAAAVAAGWNMTRPPVIAGAQSIAITPFSVASGDEALTQFGQNLVSTVSANLDGVGEIRIADPIAVLSHARNIGHLIAAADAMGIARKLGARSAVQGTLAPVGENLRADAVLLDATTGAQLARISVTSRGGDVAAMTDSLTWALLRAVWSKGNAPTPAVSGITTHSQASLREFLDGERLFARGAIMEASDAYKRAIAADTTFWFAHYRYRVARVWLAQSADTTITRRLGRHVMELPERERALVATTDSVFEASKRIEAYRRLTVRYPDYAPAWALLGDYLIHSGGYARYHIKDAVAPWQQAVRLMPNDVESANHLAYACVAAEDTTCIRPSFAHFDSIVRADSAPSALARYSHRVLIMALMPPRRALTDSLIAAGRKDSVMPVASYAQRQMLAFALATNPQLVEEWDRVASATTRGAGGLFLPDRLMRHETRTHDASRGDFSGIDDAIRAWHTPETEALAAYTRNHPLRIRALGELQGLTAPDTFTAREALFIAERRGASALQRYDAYWVEGLNALLRNDKPRFEARLRAFESDTARQAKVALRSLRAIAAGRAGRRKEAAESLLVLERQHGEVSTARVYSALAANRLLAAEWLTDEKRYAEADSLLYFTRGFTFLSGGEASEGIYATAQLVRSRIAEGMGNNAAAVRFAQIFLSAFDKAPPSQKPLLDEARNRIARLSGGDKPR